MATETAGTDRDSQEALTLTEQGRLVVALRAALAGAPGAPPVTLLETHLSWVLLAGALAYKVKKAVNLGFADFSTLAQRHACCLEELRLNRRLSPALYLDVVPIGGSAGHPVLGGGPPIEWAVKMRAFAQDGLWDRLAARGALGAPDIDALAAVLVAFHDAAAVAGPGDRWGQPAQVRAPVLDTLRALQPLCTAADDRARLDALASWEASAFAALGEHCDERLRAGRVRECHGDLHLGNVTRINGTTTVFDCLEFNPELRWTDVMNDLAFMAMDLHAHGLPRLAHRFVNAVIERSGDVDGLRVLRYGMVYRALVRAKVLALRLAQLGAGAPAAERSAATGAWRHYLDVALACSRPPAPALVITHGLSGSGKTLGTQSLLELIGAVRIRADVERKRLFGLGPLVRSDAATRAQLYSSAATAATHARLREAAAVALASGHPVILDATFLAFEQRAQARALADRLGVAFVIVDFRAPADTLRQRVQQRGLRGDDASEADLTVLEDQLAHAEPLQAEERAVTFDIDAELPGGGPGLDARWALLLQRLRGPAAAAAVDQS